MFLKVPLYVCNPILIDEVDPFENISTTYGEIN